MQKLTYQQILDLKMQENDADAETIRDYFYNLLFTLYVEGEGFSGKRPFGNSGWEHEIYTTLIKEKVVPGTLDEDGYIVNYNEQEMQTLVSHLIAEMCFGNNTES